MPGITYLWIMFHLTKLWSYMVYYCKMSSCFSIAHQAEWEKCVIMYAFNGFLPADCRSPALFLCLTLSQAGWHLDSSEGRGTRGSQRKDSPLKRDRKSLLYPPKTWPGQPHLKSKWLKLLCHPYRGVSSHHRKSNGFLLCRQETFKMVSVGSFISIQ